MRASAHARQPAMCCTTTPIPPCQEPDMLRHYTSQQMTSFSVGERYQRTERMNLAGAFPVQRSAPSRHSGLTSPTFTPSLASETILSYNHIAVASCCTNPSIAIRWRRFGANLPCDQHHQLDSGYQRADRSARLGHRMAQLAKTTPHGKTLVVKRHTIKLAPLQSRTRRRPERGMSSINFNAAKRCPRHRTLAN